MRFAGWIPCLSGKIYFHSLNAGLGDFDRYSFKITKPSGQTTIVLSSVVDWQDSYSKSTPRQFAFRVVVRARVKSDGSLQGSLLIIDRTPVPKGTDGFDSSDEAVSRPHFSGNTTFEQQILQALEKLNLKDSTDRFNNLRALNQLCRDTQNAFTTDIAFRILNNGLGLFICNDSTRPAEIAMFNHPTQKPTWSDRHSST